MAEQSFILQRLMSRERMIERVATMLKGLSQDRSWRICVAEHKPKRSDNQNRYLWGAVYPSILKASTMLQGWTAEDLHEFFLGEHFGWETVSGFGKKRMRPIRRSSALSKLEFVDYVAFIQQRMAEYGVYVADPNEIAA